MMKKDNFDFVMEKVKECGHNLCYASERLKDEFDIVLEAVKEDGNSLYYASERLRNNRKFIAIAIENCKRDILSFCKEEMRSKFERVKDKNSKSFRNKFSEEN